MPFGKDDEDDSPAQKRAPFKRDRKDFDAKEMPGKDLRARTEITTTEIRTSHVRATEDHLRRSRLISADLRRM